MSLYQICKKTVMDTSDPDIKFDDEGLSNHYLNFQKKIKPYWNPNEQSIKSLYKKIKQIKLESKSKDYSCILGLSGGIDSSYLLHILVNDFNIKPLVFHVDAGWNSEEATHNINSLVNKLNLDLYTEVIDWDEMKNWLKAHRVEFKDLEAIGSGGNINRIYKMNQKMNWQPLYRDELVESAERINNMTYEERLILLNMNLDRADVVQHASNIFLKVTKWAKIRKIHVPKVGLADGMIRQMHEERNSK